MSLQLRYHLEIIDGAQRGTLCPLYPDEPLTIGSAATANWRLTDAAVKPTHAIITIKNGQVWVENLSSTGLRLHGRLVTQHALVAVGDTLTIGDTLIALRSNAEKKVGGGWANIIFPIILVLIFIGGFIGLAIRLQQRNVAVRAITNDDWHAVYAYLAQHLNYWEKHGHLPAGFAANFSEAWFRDSSGDTKNAMRLWNLLYNQMLHLSVHGVTDGAIAVAVNDNTDKLYALMRGDWCQQQDKNFNHAPNHEDVCILWWFVSLRLQVLREKAE